MTNQEDNKMTDPFTVDEYGHLRIKTCNFAEIYSICEPVSGIRIACERVSCGVTDLLPAYYGLEHQFKVWPWLQ
jgi:hypothetical protein